MSTSNNKKILVEVISHHSYSFAVRCCQLLGALTLLGCVGVAAVIPVSVVADVAIPTRQILSGDDFIDTDGDGLEDGAESATHGTDPNVADTDGDGLDDGEEVLETLTDPLRQDTDGDGLTDGVEASAGWNPLDRDSDGGGVDDYEESMVGTEPMHAKDDLLDRDLDDDGIPNHIEGSGDFDRDGIANWIDLDSDNDGLADIVEAGGIDSNGDGMVDDLVDADGNGHDDRLAAVPLPLSDRDLDGHPDYLDLDSDQDGLSDNFEAGGADHNRDGIVDNWVDADGNGWDDNVALNNLPRPDRDADGLADYLDVESDGDGIMDLVEIGGVDFDADGRIDLFLDDDGDGIQNQSDVDSTGGADTDGDGIDDNSDVHQTGGLDTNGNGIDDAWEADVNGDGIADLFTGDNPPAIPDANNNGTPDVHESSTDDGTDAENAIPNVVTGVGCTVSSGVPVDPLLPAVMALALVGMLRRLMFSAAD